MTNGRAERRRLRAPLTTTGIATVLGGRRHTPAATSLAGKESHTCPDVGLLLPRFTSGDLWWHWTGDRGNNKFVEVASVVHGLNSGGATPEVEEGGDAGDGRYKVVESW
ncbi:unnamed protein product [Lactuca virosa]|uniref:Uncharacterized protein n=1 Tax=Lactuca virosa TaxID=75947 RepID=A0AAU9P1X8_9ASTR|nr:unnamed protein product [Lactuca virosa]